MDNKTTSSFLHFPAAPTAFLIAAAQGISMSTYAFFLLGFIPLRFLVYVGIIHWFRQGFMLRNVDQNNLHFKLLTVWVGLVSFVVSFSLTDPNIAGALTTLAWCFIAFVYFRRSKLLKKAKLS